MKRNIIICISICASEILSGQSGTWIQKASFGGAARLGATGFSIGTKGYIGTGLAQFNVTSDMYDGENKNDFWEWDQATNVWTQRADFSGDPRYFAKGFSIGSKGYIGTGFNNVSQIYMADFWEWDQATNLWTRKHDFLGGPRESPSVFVIGNKGYLCLGFNGSSFYKDLWEWDQATDNWTQKADFNGDPRGYATSFSIGTKGYVGCGWDNNSNKNDFWEWDQATNAWVRKADFAGQPRRAAAGFSIWTKGYIGIGEGNNGFHNDIWEWDQATNNWMQKTNFGGSSRGYTTSFAIANKGYISTGFDGLKKQDHWEFSVYDCGNDKVYMCHIPNNDPTHEQTICVSPSAVAAHLAQGCRLGQCIPGSMITTNAMIEQNTTEGIVLRATPNPSNNYFTLKIESDNSEQKIRLRVLDLQGRLIEQKYNLSPNQTLELGSKYLPGVYITEILQGNRRRFIKLIKL